MRASGSMNISGIGLFHVGCFVHSHIAADVGDRPFSMMSGWNANALPNADRIASAHMPRCQVSRPAAVARRSSGIAIGMSQIAYRLSDGVPP